MLFLVTCYLSLVTKMVALYLSVFGQPANKVFFSLLLMLAVMAEAREGSISCGLPAAGGFDLKCM